MKSSLLPTLNHIVPTLLVSLVATAADVTAQEALPRDRDSRRTLTVNGTGEVNAAPDQAFVRLGTTVQADEAAAAQTSVNEVMQKALSQIEKAGISKRAIRTSGLTLAPVYAPLKSGTAGEQKIVGYRASNVIEATVEDIKLVGTVIDAGLTAGANRLEGVSFGLKDDLPQRNMALTKAVHEAEMKARTMARALDVSLGPVREVIESGVQVFRQEQFAGRARMMVADGAMQTPVEPGEIRVQATVTIHYDLGSTK